LKILHWKKCDDDDDDDDDDNDKDCLVLPLLFQTVRKIHPPFLEILLADKINRQTC